MKKQNAPKMPTKKQLVNCFEHAVAMMPMKGESHLGQVDEPHAKDIAFTRTMEEVFVQPFTDQPLARRPVTLLDGHFGGGSWSHRDTHLAHLKTKMRISFGDAVMDTRERRTILEKFDNIEKFEAFFRQLYKANRERVCALDITKGF